MATFTIKTGNSRGRSLVGFRFFVSHSGGNATYQFLPPTGVGALGTKTIPEADAPSLTNLTINGQAGWTVGSATPAPHPAGVGTQWSGTCTPPGRGFKADPNTWTAESGAGPIKEKGKGAKSAKSAKSTSKKSAKGTKSTSKKGTKSAKKTRGRG